MEETGVSPCNSRVHHHAVDLGAKVTFPTGIYYKDFALDIFVEARERIMNCIDDRGREINRGAKGVDELVAFVNRGGGLD